MEFFIKKNATLPKLRFALSYDGRNDFNDMESLTGITITFSMNDVDTGFMKIVDSPCLIELIDGEYYLTFQFTKNKTKKIGRFEGSFKLTNDNGIIKLPIKEKLYINIVDSFAGDNLSFIDDVN